MKRLIYFVTLSLICFSCMEKEKEATTGGIQGSVLYDGARDKPVNGVVIELRLSGSETLAGSDRTTNDGKYIITDLTEGTYDLTATGGALMEGKKMSISVVAGTTKTFDIDVKQVASNLHILFKGAECESIDFADNLSEVPITISNFDSRNSLTWEAKKTDADWLTVEPDKGNIPSGGQRDARIIIDRSKFDKARYETSISFISLEDHGNKPLLVKATGASLPTLTTQGVTETTSTSAVFRGSITYKGNPEFTEAGFVYSTSQELKIEGGALEKGAKKLTASVSDNAFRAEPKDLQPNATYYVVAYAKNELGYGYGGEEMFSTGISKTQVTTSAPDPIGSSTATLNATIVFAGNPEYSERGFCYSKTETPTIADKHPVDGKSDVYSLPVSNLSFRTKYYVRAYAIQSGVPEFGDIIDFTTPWVDAVVTTSAPEVGANSVMLRGHVSSEGDPAYTERGFCYNKTGNPTIANKYPEGGRGVGDFHKEISNLDYETTYYVKAYVLQNNTPVYGELQTFKKSWKKADIETYAVTNIEADFATFNGKINDIGQPECSEHGFVYSSTRQIPTTGDNLIRRTGYATAYSVNVDGLSSNTTYYVRAYAIQPGDPTPVYGGVQQFTTGTPPQVETLPVTDVTRINSYGQNLVFATFHGNVKNTGSPAYVEKGFVCKIEDLAQNTPPLYEYDTVVTLPDSHTGIGPYQTVSQLLDPYDWYVVRAYVKTKSGKVYYGGVKQFDTWIFTEY
jgi:hypothetical protein